MRTKVWVAIAFLLLPIVVLACSTSVPSAIPTTSLPPSITRSHLPSGTSTLKPVFVQETQAGETQSAQRTRSASAMGTKIAQVGITLTANYRASHPTPTYTLTPSSVTPTVPPEARLKFRNLSILPRLPAGVSLSGTFVMVSPFHYRQDILNVYKKSQISLWNLETGEKHDLLPECEYVSELAVSPDRKWLAYTRIRPQNGAENKAMAIVAADGQKKAAISWKTGWGALSHWPDNQHVIIRRAEEDPFFGTFTALFVLNPFTRERLDLPPVPKDIFYLYPYPNWQGLGMISYDPELTRRVYPNDNHELALEDFQTHQILAHFPTNIFIAIPRWSPDGQQVVIASPT